MKNYEKYLELEQKLIEMEKLIEELQGPIAGQKNFCDVCGKPITDWDEVERTEDELILTYKCNECGTCAEQHYDYIYNETVIIE